MAGVDSITAKDRKSVLTSPVKVSGEIIGVLSIDSSQPSSSTHVHLQTVQTLLSTAAREIVPLLFPADRDDPGHNAH